MTIMQHTRNVIHANEVDLQLLLPSVLRRGKLEETIKHRTQHTYPESPRIFWCSRAYNAAQGVTPQHARPQVATRQRKGLLIM